jgi:LacI family transcriptional regulator
MAHRKRLTIRDVAAAAEVSIQTVSRVLNNRPDVAPETLQRVQEVIRKTGYAPNMLARSLTQGRSNVLGVVAYGLEYFGPSRVLTAIERQAAEMGYGITLNLFLEPETGDVNHVLGALRARQVDGIVWAIPDVGDNRAWSRTKGSEMPVPIILVGGMAGRPYLPSIGIDNAAIGCLATEHLLAGGARKIGIITGPLNWWEAQQRLRGWRQTLEDHGLEAVDQLVVEGDWTAASGEQGLFKLLKQSPAIDAVFASNDQMALGLFHAAHRMGLRVPDDLSVVGVDNMAEASHFWPPLTTVHQPLGHAGSLAVEEIDRMIAKARQPRHPQQAAPEITLLKPELIVRDSTRPVPPVGLVGVNVRPAGTSTDLIASGIASSTEPAVQ